MSKQEWRVGDEVEWDHAQGVSRGKVVEVATRPGAIEDFEYAASREDPRFIVESEGTGERAAHTAEALRRPSDG